MEHEFRIDIQAFGLCPRRYLHAVLLHNKTLMISCRKRRDDVSERGGLPEGRQGGPRGRRLRLRAVHAPLRRHQELQVLQG